MIDVPAVAYKDLSKGDISQNEMSELEGFADMLTSKEAAISDFSAAARGVAGNIGSVAGGGLTAGIGMGVTGLVGNAMAAGAKHIHNKLTYRRDLNKVLDVRPEIRDEYDDKDIHLAYNSMRTLNPEFAKDPLVGSTLLQQILRNRDIHDPSAAPRMDLGVARELFTAERRGRDPVQETLQRSFQAGAEASLQDHLQKARSREEMARREAHDAARDTRKMTFDALRTVGDQSFQQKLKADDRAFRQEQDASTRVWNSVEKDLDRKMRKDERAADQAFRLADRHAQQDFLEQQQKRQFGAASSLESEKAQLARGLESYKTRLREVSRPANVLGPVQPSMHPADFMNARHSMGLPNP